MQATIEAGFSGYVSNIRASTKNYKISVYMYIYCLYAVYFIGIFA